MSNNPKIDIDKNCEVTRTPEKSPTPTRTTTRTPKVTRTVTKSLTPTPSVTKSSTPTRTVTKSPTQTITPTKTITGTVTNTPTNTVTATVTKTVTPTISISPTKTITPTTTKTVTPTLSPSSPNQPDSNTNIALAGWDYVNGRVASFTNTMGVEDLSDINYRQLVLNTINWLVKNKSNPKILILNPNNDLYENALGSVLGAISNNITYTSENWSNFTGISLNNTYDIILPLMNYNWSIANTMPIDGQLAISNFIINGGSMLTCEWMMWRIAIASVNVNNMNTLEQLLPCVVSSQYSNRTKLRYQLSFYDSIISNNIPSDFMWTPTDIAGVETNISIAKPGAKIFYNSVPAFTTSATPTPTPTITPTITITITPSTTPPNIVNNGDVPPGNNSANYNSQAFWDGKANVTTVGSNGGPSAYGAFDMIGNVYQWTDYGLSSNVRGFAGVSHHNNIFFNGRDGVTTPNTKTSFTGFRVASLSNPFNFSNFVDVNDRQNAASSLGFGAVAYDYKIGKYLVTNCEYVEFLNIVARTDINSTYYNEATTGIGINRNGTSGSYTYTAKTNYGNKPVVGVSWFECARYCNWLHNNKANITETGAYTLNAMNINAVVKNNDAKYHIPHPDEWYKAAYYKSGSQTAGYWAYPTQSNTLPSSVTADSAGNGPVTSLYTCLGVTPVNTSNIPINPIRTCLDNFQGLIYGIEANTSIIGLTSGAKWTNLYTSRNSSSELGSITRGVATTSNNISFIEGEIVFIDTRSSLLLPQLNITGHYQIQSASNDLLKIQCLTLNKRIMSNRNDMPGSSANRSNITYGAVSSDNTKLYIIGQALNSFTVLDILTNKVIRTITLPYDSPTKIVVSSQFKKIYIACRNNIVAMDEDTYNIYGGLEFPLGLVCRDMVIDESTTSTVDLYVIDATKVYRVVDSQGFLSLYRTITLSNVGGSFYQIFIIDSKYYIIIQGNATTSYVVFDIDNMSNTGPDILVSNYTRFKFSAYGYAVYDKLSKKLYIADTTDSFVSIIDTLTNTEIGTLDTNSLSGAKGYMALNEQTQLLYLASTRPGNPIPMIEIFDLNTNTKISDMIDVNSYGISDMIVSNVDILKYPKSRLYIIRNGVNTVDTIAIDDGS
jgi:formylglycine-generating enzyme required for sulfatase activity